MGREVSELGAVYGYAFLPLLAHTTLGSSCASANLNANDVAFTNPQGTDAVVHVTYGFEDSNGNLITPAPNVAAAVNAAVQQWNSFTSSTNVHFDPAPASNVIQPDITFASVTDAQAKGCTASFPNGNDIAYGPLFTQAATNQSVGTTIMAHELGHLLGLDDAGIKPTVPSIMNNPSNAPPPAACTNPVFVTGSVQASDASQVPKCKVAVRSYRVVTLKKTQSTDMTQPVPWRGQAQTTPLTCTGNYTYNTVNFYVDGQFDSSMDFVSAFNVVCQ